MDCFAALPVCCNNATRYRQPSHILLCRLLHKYGKTHPMNLGRLYGFLVGSLRGRRMTPSRDRLTRLQGRARHQSPLHPLFQGIGSRKLPLSKCHKKYRRSLSLCRQRLLAKCPCLVQHRLSTYDS